MLQVKILSKIVYKTFTVSYVPTELETTISKINYCVLDKSQYYKVSGFKLQYLLILPWWTRDLNVLEHSL